MPENITKNRGTEKWAGKVGPLIKHWLKSILRTNIACKCAPFEFNNDYQNQFVTLNRLRCGQARCAESLHRWGVIASPACPCGESHQTTRHISCWRVPTYSLHSLEACNVYTKRVLMQWNDCRDCHWNCESVPNEQQQHYQNNYKKIKL